MVRNTINSYDSDEKKITLEDLTENGEEKLADIPDEELQQLKQQAIEAEDYDIAKLIKQEQTERAERAKETGEDVKDEDDLQELEDQTKREEEWKSIQEKKVQSKEEAMAKVDNLITQLNDGEDLQEDEDSQELDWQARREDTLKTAKIDGSRPQTNNNNEEENPKDNNSELVEENKDWLKDVSDEEILHLYQSLYDVNHWLYREDLGGVETPDYAGDEEVLYFKEKFQDENPDIKNKILLYEWFVNKIADDVIADHDKNYGILSGDPDEMQKIIYGLSDIQNKMEEENLYDSDGYDKLEKIIKFFEQQKEKMEDYLSNGYYRG